MHITTMQMPSDNRKDPILLIARIKLSGLVIAEYGLAMRGWPGIIE